MARSEVSAPPLKKRKPNVANDKKTARSAPEKAKLEEGTKQMQSLSMLAPTFQFPSKPVPTLSRSTSIAHPSPPRPTRSSNAIAGPSVPKNSKNSMTRFSGSQASQAREGLMKGRVISIDSGSEEQDDVRRVKPKPNSATKRAHGFSSSTDKALKITKDHPTPPPPKAPSPSASSSSDRDPNDDGPEEEAASSSMMWTDLFSPSALQDLAPSKTRIGPLRSWLHEAIHGERLDPGPPAALGPGVAGSSSTRNRDDGSSSGKEKARHALRKMRRLLILSGPAGVGKTTTLRVIAEEMGVEVVDWVDESQGSIFGFGGEGSMDRFTSFLARSSYNPLELNTANSHDTALSSSSHPTRIVSELSRSESGRRPRLILLSALPNLATPAQRSTFQSALFSFVQSYEALSIGTIPSGASGSSSPSSIFKSGPESSCPLVIVIPDEGLSGTAEESWMAKGKAGGGSGSEGWNAKGIVGEALRHPATSWITFPPIAPTFMTKALKRVLKLGSDHSVISTQVRSIPSDEVVRAISQTANGDLRSAINSLQFLCMSGMFPGKPKAKGKDPRESKVKKTGKGSRGGKGGALSGDKQMMDMLNAISRREQSLGLFHALGKVLYNKRRGDPDADGDEPEVQIVETDPLPTHLSTHERRPYQNDFDALLGTVPVDTATFTLWLHQNTPQFCDDIDQNHLALDDICASDIMKTDTDYWATNVQSIAYAFNVSVRGTAMALPSPVPRNNQKMYKPAYFDMLRRSKEYGLATSSLAKLSAVKPSDEAQNQETPDRTEKDVKIWTTEYMPFYRQMKRYNGDDPRLAGIDATGLSPEDMEDPPQQHRLMVLLDGDDAEVAGGDELYEDAVEAESSIVPQTLEPSPKASIPEVAPEVVTWLLDDDIED